jgi:hypothetical protein
VVAHQAGRLQSSARKPIGAGFIASLARPGGSVTGVLNYEVGIIGKWLALLKEIAPRVTRAALVGNPKTTSFLYFQRAAEAAASLLAIELVPVTIENSEADIERVIEWFAATPNGGLVVLPDTTTSIRRDLIVALAARNHLPAVYPYRAFVDFDPERIFLCRPVDVERTTQIGSACPSTPAPSRGGVGRAKASRLRHAQWRIAAHLLTIS